MVLPNFFNFRFFNSILAFHILSSKSFTSCSLVSVLITFNESCHLRLLKLPMPVALKSLASNPHQCIWHLQTIPHEVQDDLRQRKKKAMNLIECSRNVQLQTSHVAHVGDLLTVRAPSKEASLPFANFWGIRHAVLTI